jgi:hypothetical protein
MGDIFPEGCRETQEIRGLPPDGQGNPSGRLEGPGRWCHGRIVRADEDAQATAIAVQRRAIDVGHHAICARQGATKARTACAGLAIRDWTVALALARAERLDRGACAPFASGVHFRAEPLAATT